MTAFDEVFRELANAEYLGFALEAHGRRPAGSFMFRELFCSRPRCKCTSVTIVAIHVERQRVAAIIHYALAGDKGPPFLDPEGPTDALSHELLAIFNDGLGNGYRETLLRHQGVWRSAVDNRSHPAHATLRALTSETPEARPRSPRRAKQPTATATGVELAIAQRARNATSKAQQRFTRLARKVEGLRARLRAWHDQRPAIDRGLALYAAELSTQRDLARRFIEALDTLLADPQLAKKHRPKLRQLLCSIARDLIEDGQHDLKPIHDRHAARSYDKEESDGVASLKAMMEVMGMDLDGVDVRSFDDLAAVADRERQRLDEDASASARRRATRKKTAKQVERETLAEAQQRDASKALQDVFRKLAVALHPDLEQDPSEQARKTALMQEVNAAYKRKDLLRLLELQLKFERVDENARDIAEERLVHYTRILDDQAKQLASELEDLELPFRVQLDLPPPQSIGPNDVIAALNDDTEDLRQTIAMQREDLVALGDPKRIPEWLRTIPSVSRRGGEIPF